MPRPAPYIIPDRTPHTAPRSVSILGATGSIGDSTLRVIAEHAEQFPIIALTAQENAEKLIQLALRFRPRCVAIGNTAHYATVNAALGARGIRVFAGAQGIMEAASMACDITVAAIVGAAGLAPTMAAIAQGKQVALANKEALVCAGDLVLNACRTHGTTLLPIDSEHNAIFQVLQKSPLPHWGRGLGEGNSPLCTNLTAPSPNLSPSGGGELPADPSVYSHVEKITLTASGGPLLRRPLDSMASVTVEEAVSHPRWRMGAKISVDSATMMNKGLELIEAHYLFGLPAERIDVLIHPQSIIHSLVHFTDGSVLAQLGMPDMAIPIAYTLSWPQRLQVATPRLDLAQIATLEFLPPDPARFPALALARAALAQGASALIALNAANEIAVDAFLHRRIGFPHILTIVEQTLAQTPSQSLNTLDAVHTADATARTLAQEYIEKI